MVGFHFFSRNYIDKALVFCLLLGLFIQISGKVWIGSGSARNSQIYIWLLLPTLLFLATYRFSSIKISYSKSDLLWLSFLLWVASSAFWATDSEHDAFSLAKRGLLIALYLYSIRILITINESFLRNALLAAVAMVAIGALVSLVNQYLVVGRPLSYRAFRIDRSGIGNLADYGWPVAAGIFHGGVSLWALGISFQRQTSSKIAGFWFLVFSVLALYVYFTFSRGAWFALLAGSVAVILLQKSRRGWIALFIGGAVSLVTFALYWTQLLVEFEDKQISGRGFIWEYYLEVMKGYWIFGHGLGTPFAYHWPGSDAVSPHAHSLYLQQIYDSGLVSLILLLSALFLLARRAWHYRRNKWICLAVPPLIFALVAMITDVERLFTRPGDYWTVFWLPVAIILGIPKHMLQRT